MKNIRIFYLNFFFVLVVKFSVYLNRRVFVMKEIRANKIQFKPSRHSFGKIRSLRRSFFPIDLLPEADPG